MSPSHFQILEDLSFDDLMFDPRDTHFKSELDYDGYRDIEEYDNHAYSSGVESMNNPETELNFEERTEGLDIGSESIIDPQENKTGAYYV